MKIQSRFQFELVFAEKYCFEIQKFQILTAKDFENLGGFKTLYTHAPCTNELKRHTQTPPRNANDGCYMAKVAKKDMLVKQSSALDVISTRS